MLLLIIVIGIVLLVLLIGSSCSIVVSIGRRLAPIVLLRLPVVVRVVVRVVGLSGRGGMVRLLVGVLLALLHLLKVLLGGACVISLVTRRMLLELLVALLAGGLPLATPSGMVPA